MAKVDSTTNVPLDGSLPQTTILEGEFSVKKLPCVVTLSESCIAWKDGGSKSNVRDSTTSTELSDILAVHSLQQHTGSAFQVHPQHGFRLHYTQKHANKHWKHAVADFVTEDKNVATEWIDALQVIHRKAVADRPRKLLIYINPVSGGSNSRHIFQKHAVPLFKLANIKTDVIVTESSGHIKEHIQQLDLSAIDGICVVGGDGTFTEAALGLAIRKVREEKLELNDVKLCLKPLDIRLGMIPAGTGNGTANSSTGTFDVTTSVLHIINGHSYRMDAFTVHDDDRFVSLGNIVCGFGFFSNLIESSESNRWIGKGRYAWGFMKSMTSFTKFPAEVHFNLVKRKEDGMVDHDSPNQEYKVIQDVFLDVAMFPFNFAEGRCETGVMYAQCIRGSVNRKGLIKHFAKLARMKPDSFDFDFVDRYDASRYRIILTRPSQAKSDASPSHSTEQLHNDELKIPSTINIDGDAYPVTGSILQIKNHSNIIHVFGQHEVYTTGLNKKKSVHNE